MRKDNHMNLTRKLTATSLAALIALAPMPSYAFFGGGIVHDPINLGAINAVGVAVGAVGAAVTASGASIVVAVQTAATEITKVSAAGDLMVRQQLVQNANEQMQLTKTMEMARDAKAAQEKVFAAQKETRVTAAACDARRSSGVSRGVNSAMVSGNPAVTAAMNATVGSRDKVTDRIVPWSQKMLEVKNNKDLCTASDVANSSARGLSCSAVGKKAGADTSAASIFQAAGTGPGTSKPADKTLEGDDIKIAAQAINNIITGDPPITLTKAQEGTQQGKIYLAMLKTYNARISSYKEVLSDALMKSSAIPKDSAGYALAKSSWASKGSVFREVYGPSARMPEVPSPNAAMDLEVKESTTKTYLDNVARLSGDEASRELIKRVDLNTRVNYELYQLMSKVAIAQASNYASQQEPISPEKLEAVKRAAQESVK